MVQNLENRLIYVGEGDIISLDDLTLEIYAAPGHTPDHIAILDRKNMNLFPGDSIGGHHLGSGFSRPTAYPPYFNHESYSKTVKKLSLIDNLNSVRYKLVFSNDIHQFFLFILLILPYIENN